MTSESAISVIMLMVKPATYMKKNVAMTEVGSASAEISVERQSRMNTKMIEHGHDAAEDDVLADLGDVLLDEVRVVVDLLMSESCGKVGITRASVSRTRRVISTVLAPDCLRTANDTASTPFRRVVRRALGVAVDDRGDVLHADGRAAVRAEDDVLDLLDPDELALGAERDVAALADDRAGRHVEVLGASCSATRAERQAEAPRAGPGSRLTWISRTSPPLTSTAATPSICSMSGFSSSSTWRRVTSEGWRRADRVGHDRQRRDVETLDRRDPRSPSAAGSGWPRPSRGPRRPPPADRPRGEARCRPARAIRASRYSMRLTPLMPATASSIGLVTQRLDLLGRCARVDHGDVDEREVDLGEEVDAEPRSSTRCRAP